MNDSILNTIKKLIGIDESYTQFDTDLIVHINSVFTILQQLGYGPENGFSITDASTTWGEYTDATQLNLIQTYIFLQVRLLFDSGSLNSASMEMIKQKIAEFEWRINVAVDPR